MKNPLAPVKNFVVKHKVGVAIATTATVTTAAYVTLDVFGIKAHNEFLKEQGLYDLFYTRLNTIE